MTDLVYAGGNNVAGNHLIRCAPVVGLLTLPTAGDGVVSGQPTFLPGYNWVFLYGTEGTKTYSESCEESDNGDIWTVSAGLFYPGDSAEVRRSLANLKSLLRFVVDVQDKHGVWRRLGTLTEYFSLEYRFAIGAQIGDRRGYTLTFSGIMTTCPPILLP